MPNVDEGGEVKILKKMRTSFKGVPLYVSLPAHATVLWPFAIAFATDEEEREEEGLPRYLSRGQLFTFSPRNLLHRSQKHSLVK